MGEVYILVETDFFDGSKIYHVEKVYVDREDKITATPYPPHSNHGAWLFGKNLVDIKKRMKAIAVDLDLYQEVEQVNYRYGTKLKRKKVKR